MPDESPAANRSLPVARTLLLIWGAALAGGAGPALPVGSTGPWANGGGLSSVRSAYVANGSLGGPGSFQNDRFATALASGDLNGDDFDDLVVGVPGDDDPAPSPASSSGAVLVFFGGPTGVVGGGSPRRLTQPGSGIEPGDEHGFALAVCDFNGDQFDDLAVGAPGEDLGSTFDAGAVFIYPGGPNGPSQSGIGLYTQDTEGIPGTAEAFDQFGVALACGNFDNGGFDDLVIAATGEDLGATADAGWIVVLPGSAGGLLPSASLAFDQSHPEVASDPETNDRFGCGLAVGDLDGDGRDDLAVGVCGEDQEAGAVHVFFGSSVGLQAAGGILLTDAGLGGLSEAGDRFGASLAFGDFDGDDFADLVVGSPDESFAATGGPLVETGQVTVVYGSSAIPTLGVVEVWIENNLHGAGWSDSGDQFGSAIAAGDFTGDGIDDLAIGHSGETLTARDDGAVTIVAGSATGIDPAARSIFSAGAEGLGGPNSILTPARRFGAALAAGDFDGDGHADLAVGGPDEQAGGQLRSGAVWALRGALYADGFEDGGPEP